MVFVAYPIVVHNWGVCLILGLGKMAHQGMAFVAYPIVVHNWGVCLFLGLGKKLQQNLGRFPYNRCAKSDRMDIFCSVGFLGRCRPDVHG